MADLPTGTVTFLFTDIEGSTPLWEQHPEAMRGALATHHAHLRKQVETHGGTVFEIVGDAFCAAFTTADDALAAALAVQYALRVIDWGQTPIRIRVGLFTGQAERAGERYQSGPTLNRVARVMSIAHGGQILLSQTTADLVRSRLPAGVSLRDMGNHSLKGLSQAERIWQVVAPNLPSEFPPLKTHSGIPHNLPQQLTSFVGRETEIGEVQRLLSTTRLLTLTGAGGSGKTRLSLESAGGLLAHYPDGIWFVEFAPLADPEFVPQAVASALKLAEQPGWSMQAALIEYLRDSRMLLLFDNCEHLVEACARLADALLHAAPAVTILATSREPLNIAGETTFPVQPLPVPGSAHSTEGATPAALNSEDLELMRYTSVRLFAERAGVAKPNFQVTSANVQAVAQICQRLDGMPLAIELAAARIRVLSAEQIAARLHDRFRLLTGGSRTAVRRQQTLRATIDWSFSLLAEPERVLLRRLAVFAGGWTLDAAEAVGGDDAAAALTPVHAPAPVVVLPHADVLDLLTRLVEKSLVVEEESAGESRYHMLETIREYALERLLESGEGNATRDKHLEYCLRLTAHAEAETHGPDQIAKLDRLEREHDNLRQAMEWSLAGQTHEKGLRLASDLFSFWYLRGHQNEGTAALQHFLSLPSLAAHTELRGLALTRYGHFQYRRGAYADALAPLNAALAIGRELGSPAVMGFASLWLGAVADVQGDTSSATRLIEQSLMLFEQIGDHQALGITLSNLASIAHGQGDLARAVTYYEKGLAHLEAIGDMNMQAFPLRHWAMAVLDQGDAMRAAELCRRSVRCNWDTGDLQGVAASMTTTGAILLRGGHTVRAVQLFGAADKLVAALHTRIIPLDYHRYTRNLALTREQLSPADFDAAWAAGRALTLEQAVALALEETHGS